VLGFQFGEKLEREREEELDVGVRPEAFIGRQDMPRHDVELGEVDSEREEEEHGVVLAGMREERMRTIPPLVDIQRRGIGLLGGLVMGCCWAPQLGCYGQVSPGRFFSPFPFLFSFLFFISC
jgi:hypothetical protein